MSKRFKSEFKRSKSYLANQLLIRVLGKKLRGKEPSIFVIQNWIYGRTPNEMLETEFEKLLIEVEPGSLEGAFIEEELSDAV